jgi:hypothetical protein
MATVSSHASDLRAVTPLSRSGLPKSLPACYHLLLDFVLEFDKNSEINSGYDAGYYLFVQ